MTTLAKQNTTLVSRQEAAGHVPETSASEPAARLHLPLAKLFHWGVAAVVLLLVFSGVVMKQLGEGSLSMQLYTLHKTAGAVALLLVVMRICYRVVARMRNRWNKASGAHAVHLVLYGAMLLVPLLGWAGVSDFGARGVYFGLQLPMIWPEGAGYADQLFMAHAYLAFGLLALVAIHIGIALEDYVMRHSSQALPVDKSTDQRVPGA